MNIETEAQLHTCSTCANFMLADPLLIEGLCPRRTWEPLARWVAGDDRCCFWRINTNKSHELHFWRENARHFEQ